MRMVLDTDVVVAAIRSPYGASAELVRLARSRKFDLVLTVPMIIEYESVVTRPDHVMASGMSEAEVQAILDTIVDISTWTRIYFSYRPATVDPSDDFILEAAINGRADAIATFNRRDFGDAPSRFGIACLLPHEALETLR